MQNLTVESILKLKPCSEYTEQRLQELFGNRTSALLAEIMTWDHVPAADRVWLAVRVVSKTQRIRLTEIWVERAIRRVYDDAPDCMEAVGRWLSGEDRSKAAARAAGQDERNQQIKDILKIISNDM